MPKLTKTTKMRKPTHMVKGKTKCKICGRKNITFIKKHFRFYMKCKTQYEENGWMDEVVNASRDRRRKNKIQENKLIHSPQKRKQTCLQKKKSKPKKLKDKLNVTPKRSENQPLKDHEQNNDCKMISRRLSNN